MDLNPAKAEPPSPAPAIAWTPVLIVAIATIVLRAICLTQYGWFRDELYYLSCSKRLAWGYVDQPPFSIAVMALLRTLAGESLAVFRLAAAFFGAITAILSALIARELGGRRYAQTVAAAVTGFCPMLLGVGGFYSMNIIDFAFWGLCTWLALRAFRRGSSSDWILLGVALGLGLLNKWSVLWLGGGLFVGLLLSPQRRLLATKGPWLAAGIAALLVTPNLLWEVQNQWATLEFMHNARTMKMARLEPVGFFVNQLLQFGPFSAPLSIAGLIASFTPARPRWRLIGAVYVVTLAVLLSSGSARMEYIALPFVALFAAGATWWESRGRVLRSVIAVAAIVLALPLVPFGIPILPVQQYIVYQAALKQTPNSEERQRVGPLPQHFADQFGWPEMADSVARVAATLPEAERRAAIVVVDNYGEAGALERFGKGRIPTIACQHNNWYLWGPPKWDGATAIFVNRDSAEVASEFDEVIVAGTAGHRLAMPYEQDCPILIARRFRGNLVDAWKAGRHYI